MFELLSCLLYSLHELAAIERFLKTATAFIALMQSIPLPAAFIGGSTDEYASVTGDASFARLCLYELLSADVSRQSKCHK